MAFSINTNNASMEALATLRQTNAALTTTENQVSTGKKVNSASDDPAIYAISQSMNSQISGLAGINTGLQVTAQVVSLAATQASSTSTLLSGLASTIAEAGTKGLDADTLNQTIQKALVQVNANANGATFKGVNLLSGAIGNGVTSTTASSVQDLSGTLFQQAGANATATGLGLDQLSVNQAGLDIGFGGTSPTALVSGSTSPGANTSITLSTLSASSTSGSTPSSQNIAVTTTFALTQGITGGSAESDVASALSTTLNGLLGGTPTTPAALTIGTSGKIDSASLTSGSGYTVATSTNASGNNVYTFTSATAGTSPVTLTQGQDSSGNATLSLATAVDANKNTTAESNYVFVKTSQPTTAADFSSATGSSQVDALSTAIQNAGFGVSKDSTTGDLHIAGGNLDTTAAQTTTIKNLTGGTTTAESGSTDALLAVNAAITSINKISSALGSSSNLLTGLQSTTSSLSDALTSGVGALTDADLSAESAKLTSLQTKQSLAIQSLSIANSQSQSLLTLFR